MSIAGFPSVFSEMFGDQLEVFPRLLATDWLAEPIESSVKDNARRIQLVQTTIATGYCCHSCKSRI